MGEAGVGAGVQIPKTYTFSWFGKRSNIEQEVNMKKILSTCLLSASAVAFAEVQQIGDEGMKTLGTDFV